MGKSFNGCPGAADIRGTPKLKEKVCPDCGKIIELFSGDMQVQCKCGFIVYNNIASCISWCAYAEECVGIEMYEKIKSINGNND